MVSFHFDKRKFERDLKRAVEKETRSAMSQIADEMTRDYAEMSQRLQGRPLDEIKAELQAYYRREGGSITDPELTDHAELLRAGETIEFRHS